jgi:simple sugar transport system ATP-binding protein
MGSQILVAQDICKNFGGVKALQNVNFEVSPAEIHCLVGENGSGKSTLVKVISGVHQADSGTIVLNGHSYQKMSVINAIHEGVQVIYQDLSLFLHMNVAENIATNKLISQNKRYINWKEIYGIAEEQLSRIGVSLDLKAPVEKLSISNMQLVAICRALSLDAKILFMDEPTTALTSTEVDKLLSIVMELKNKGMSIVFISHKLDEIMEVADRVAIFRDGQKVGDFPSGELDEKKLIFYMTGKNVMYSRYQRLNESNEEVLKVENLTREPHYYDLNVSLNKGEILGLTGLLGSGRTEFALSLFGLNPPDSGKIFIKGNPYTPTSPEQAIKNRISLVPEDRQTQGIYLTKSISDNISASILDRLSNKLGLLKKSKQDQIALGVVKNLNVKTSGIEADVQELSGGNQQKVVLGKWIETSPEILILDSPTVGVDIGSKAEIYECIKKLAGGGMAIILISDELPELLANCNRIMLLKEGRVVGEIDEKDFEAENIKEDINRIMTSDDGAEVS